MISDNFPSEIDGNIICRAERRVAYLQQVLSHLAKDAQSTEFAVGLVKTFEEDLALSRAKLAQLK